MKDRNELLNEVKTNLQNRYYLDQEQQELINDCVDELLKAINYTHCCETLPTKNYEVYFSNHLRAGIQIVENEIKIVGAVDGWGNGVTKDAITIKEV